MSADVYHQLLGREVVLGTCMVLLLLLLCISTNKTDFQCVSLIVSIVSKSLKKDINFLEEVVLGSFMVLLRNFVVYFQH